jgi:hypothetical protein
MDVPIPERKVLDNIVFDILGLTEEEQNDVYWGQSANLSRTALRRQRVCEGML